MTESIFSASGQRGLKPGMKADVVVFNPETIWGEEHWDKADTEPEGIEWVIVNGAVVLDKGKHTGAFPGRFLSKLEN